MTGPLSSKSHHFKDIELYTVELAKLENVLEPSELSAYLKKVKTALDAWVTFLTKHALLDRNNLPKELSDPAIKKALHTLDVMNFSRAEREEYEDHLKWLRMEDSAIRKVGKDNFKKGKVEVIKNMLKQSISKKDIAAMTGVSIDEVEKIEKKN